MNINLDLFKNKKDILVSALLLLVNDGLLKVVCHSVMQWKAFFINLMILTLIFGTLSLFRIRSRRIFESILVFITSLYCFAQAYHFRFFETYFSLSKLTILSELVDVREEIGTKFVPGLLLFLIPPLLWILYLKKYPAIRETYHFFTKRTFATLCIVALTIGAYNETFRIKDGEDFGFAKLTSDSDLYRNMTNKQRFMDRFGYLCFAYKDLRRIATGHGHMQAEDTLMINTYINENRLSENEMTGLFKGKNLILIMCESCGYQAIDEELTPTLYQLSQQGFDFDQCYAPLYPSNTNDSEFIANTSMIPSIEQGTTSKLYSYNRYPYSLANLLKSQYDYDCNSFHSFYGGFYGREQFHSSLGYTRFYALEELQITMPENAIDYLNWPEDSELFEKTLTHTDRSGPFLDFIITASGHTPYKSRRAELKENHEKVLEIKGDTLDEESAYYYAAQMKLDQGLETLINELKDNNLYDNTVIALFGDHWPYGISGEESLQFFYGDNKYEFQKYHVPFIIWSSDIEGQTISKMASTFDVYPTLCNLFGLNTDGAWITGNDLFSDTQQPIPFADGSVLGQSFWYNAATGEIHKLSDSATDVQQSIVDAHNMLKYGQELLQSDYYRK